MSLVLTKPRAPTRLTGPTGSVFLPVASTKKNSIREVSLPWVLGCLLHPHPAQQPGLPLQKELRNAEVAHLHRVATEAVVWVSHPAPQKSCHRGVINIPVAHVSC